MEVLSPAGDFNKLKIAINYGADAVYFAGNKFGLRTFAGNFTDDEIVEAIKFAHSKNVKCYITCNILARTDDFSELIKYVKFLKENNADAVIVSDIGVFLAIRKAVPDIDIHISTQCNILNVETAKFFADAGAKRLILARELSLEEIKKIKKAVGNKVEIECFVHGAMCISYSGRCLLSNFMTGRDSNRGACVQSCRWNYEVREVSRESSFPVEEDKFGTYIFNSKDMCMIEHIKDLYLAGIDSLKIEGRMKTEYYVANITNAYRMAVDSVESNKLVSQKIIDEVYKSSHREYCTGFYYSKAEENLKISTPVSDYEFVAMVLDDTDESGYTLVEMRNRFKLTDELELLSPKRIKPIKLISILNEFGEEINDVKLVQSKVRIKSNCKLKKLDILRRKIKN